LEWLADEVVEAGGESSIWIAEPATAAQERELVNRLSQAAAAEYQAVIAEARVAALDDEAHRLRTLTRLRRELRRIADRDYFPPPERNEAREAVEALAMSTEVTP
jgi:nitroimidazol reductase NimA-like FMN-containing flavoprotein (pyridoxamine 5'-phosphate oxidase superfamily)